MSFSGRLVELAKLAIVALLLVASTGQAKAESPATPTQQTKPRVLEFYASWAQPCQQLKPAMERAKEQYADDVEFVSYDVDDPAVSDVVEQYGVCPVPTVIFIGADSKISSYAVGCQEDEDGSIRRGINKMLSRQNPDAHRLTLGVEGVRALN